MGDPPCKKQQWCGGGEVQRVIYVGTYVKIIAYMIKCHNDHHCSAEHINGLDAELRCDGK